MIETMHAAPGVGLAAPQVGVGAQVFVWRYGGAGSFDTQYRDVLQLDEGPARGFNTVLHGVVVNPLLADGYPSIGCEPCTRRVPPGEDPRSGRWAGFAKTEGGIHL